MQVRTAPGHSDVLTVAGASPLLDRATVAYGRENWRRKSAVRAD